MKQQPLKILLVSSRPSQFSAFVDTLSSQSQLCIDRAESYRQGADAFAAGRIDVAIVDQTLGSETGIRFVRDVVCSSPLTNCALVSELTPGDFHEATEGLGILLQLPPTPGADDANRLVAVLGKIYGLMESPSANEGQQP